HAKNQPVNNMPYQCSKKGGSLVGGPIQGVPADRRQNRQGSQEPPENSKSESPSHAGAQSEYIRLEKQSKKRSNHQGDCEMRFDHLRFRMQYSEPAQQRIEFPFIH